MNHENNFQSKDFYLSACIRATGAQLIQLKPIDQRTFLFVFDIPPAEASQLIEDHWNNRLILSTKAVIDAINELKTRLHQGF